MSRHIPKSIKEIVITRARNRCEYCLLENDLVYISHQIDHIIGLKHGGKTAIENLAYSCFSCNNNKGSDIGTIIHSEKQFIRLFNPRIDNWHEHFEIISGIFQALTPVGEATIKILKINSIEKIMERNI